MSTTASIYVRQSLDASGEGLAVERQEKECRQLARQLGLKVAAHVYSDNDTSATSGVERPEFDALLAARPAAILVWHIDRLCRLTRDLERVIDLGVPVHAVTAGHVDLSTPSGRAVARTVTAWATYEGEQKSLRQKASHNQRRASGRPWGTRRAFGYEDDGVTVRASEADVVRDMYDWLLSGQSQAEIARRLNAAGVLTTLGNPWRQSSVRALLVNARNAGFTTQKDAKGYTEVVGHGVIDPIVGEDVWRSAVDRMRPIPGRRGGGRRTNLLSGLARCTCGSTVRSSTSVRGQRQYVCPAGHVGRDADSVDSLVVDVVLGRLARADAAALLVDESQDDAVTLLAEAEDCRTAMDALAVALADGTLSVSAFHAGTARVSSRLAEIQQRMVSGSGRTALAEIVGADDVRAMWEAMSLAQRRGVIDALMTVTILRTTRGARFRPESVRIDWA